MKFSLLMLSAALFLLFLNILPLKAEENPRVLIKTNKGDIIVELYKDKAPVSVENFISYVNDSFYNGLIFHRVMKDFMIQAGGFDTEMNRQETKNPIKNEAGNGLKNNKGTISYARTNIIDSATSQFFINHADNSFLDHRSDSLQEYGYAVFGEVIEGMKVVDEIANVKIHTHSNGMKNVPVNPVLILSAEIIVDQVQKDKAEE